jgi:hypothetical protein
MDIKVLGPKQSLSYLTGINRPIRPDQVTKLATSLNKMGNIRPLVVATISFITGKATKYIIDGQHLFNALLRNGLPIEYVEIKVDNLTDLVEKIALLNSSSKSWTLVDYITAWSCVIEDYKKLFKYYNIFDFEINMLAAVLAGKNIASSPNGASTSMCKSIKLGNFRITDEAKHVQILNDLTDILNIIPRMGRIENRYVCNEYVSFRRTVGSKYTHDTFLKNLALHKQKFILATQEPDKLSEMFKKLVV